LIEDRRADEPGTGSSPISPRRLSRWEDHVAGTDSSEGSELLERDLAFLQLLAATEFPVDPENFRRPGFGCDATSVCWQSALERLRNGIEDVTGAREARIILRIYEREFQAPSREITAAGMLPSGEAGCDPSPLTVPILVDRQQIGLLQARCPQRGEFTAKHRRLLSVASVILGLTAVKATMCQIQQEFIHRVRLEAKLKSMLFDVWSLTEENQTDLDRILPTLLSTIRKGLPFCCAMLRTWDDRGVRVHDALDSQESRASAFLKDIVDREGLTIVSDGSVWARRYDQSDPDCAGQAGSLPAAVIILPLRRFRSVCGILGIARTGTGATFTTEERKTLCIVSGLLPDPFHEVIQTTL